MNTTAHRKTYTPVYAGAELLMSSFAGIGMAAVLGRIGRLSFELLPVFCRFRVRQDQQ
jgi:hypothetical protein